MKRKTNSFNQRSGRPRLQKEEQTRRLAGTQKKMIPLFVSAPVAGGAMAVAQEESRVKRATEGGQTAETAHRHQ
jgi:hypothetical protein